MRFLIGVIRDSQPSPPIAVSRVVVAPNSIPAMPAVVTVPQKDDTATIPAGPDIFSDWQQNAPDVAELSEHTTNPLRSLQTEPDLQTEPAPSMGSITSVPVVMFPPSTAMGDSEKAGHVASDRQTHDNARRLANETLADAGTRAYNDLSTQTTHGEQGREEGVRTSGLRSPQVTDSWLEDSEQSPEAQEEVLHNAFRTSRPERPDEEVAGSRLLTEDSGAVAPRALRVENSSRIADVQSVPGHLKVDRSFLAFETERVSQVRKQSSGHISGSVTPPAHFSEAQRQPGPMSELWPQQPSVVLPAPAGADRSRGAVTAESAEQPAVPPQSVTPTDQLRRWHELVSEALSDVGDRASAARSAAAALSVETKPDRGRRASSEPRVQIGQVDIHVSAPVAPLNSPSAAAPDNFAARHYLRSL